MDEHTFPDGRVGQFVEESELLFYVREISTDDNIAFDYSDSHGHYLKELHIDSEPFLGRG